MEYVLREERVPAHEEPHPDREQIELFLLGEGSRKERQLVVLHLLRGCPGCRDLARDAWYRAEARKAQLLAFLSQTGHGAPPPA